MKLNPPIDNMNELSKDEQEDINKIMYNAAKEQLRKKCEASLPLNNKLYANKRIDEEIIIDNVRILDVDRQLTIDQGSEVEKTDSAYEQILGRIFKMSQKRMKMQAIGRKYFDPKAKQSVQQLEIFPGYEISLSSYGAKVRKNSVLELINKQQEQSGSGQISGSIIMTGYGDVHRFYKIHKIREDLTPRSEFEINKDKKMSYIQYYKERYNIRIDESQPLIEVQKKKPRSDQIDTIFLIPEICFMTGLTDDMRADFNLMKQVSTYTKPNPSERIKQSQHFIKELEKNNQKYLNNWGIQINQNPFSLNYQSITPGAIVMGQNKQIDIEKSNLDRDTQCEMLKTGETSQKESILFYEPRDENVANNFERMLRDSAQFMKFPIKLNKYKINGRGPQGWIETIQKTTQNPLNYSLVVLLLPGQKKKGLGYNELKRFLINEYPIPSQVILVKTFDRAKDGQRRTICNKLLVQISAKTGGVPWTVNKMPFSNEPSMIFGIDVYHCSGNQSILGVIGTLDNTFGRYFSESQIHEEGQEIATKIGSSVRNGLIQFGMKNGLLPKNIIVYRDGVSRGQIRTVTETEVETFKKVYKDVQQEFSDKIKKIFDLKMSYVIVNKRVNAKFYATQVDDIFKSQNVDQGTIINSDVTLSDNDFYIISQKTRQGTSTPTHYDVISTDHQDQMKDLQVLTFKLCFLYYNLTGAVKIPSPCYYAHSLSNFIGDRYDKRDPKSLIKAHKRFLNYLYFI